MKWSSEDTAKCELFSRDNLEGFPADFKMLHEPYLCSHLGM